jgi:hypothetical protein
MDGDRGTSRSNPSRAIVGEICRAGARLWGLRDTHHPRDSDCALATCIPVLRPAAKTVALTIELPEGWDFRDFISGWKKLTEQSISTQSPGDTLTGTRESRWLQAEAPKDG